MLKVKLPKDLAPEKIMPAQILGERYALALTFMREGLRRMTTLEGMATKELGISIASCITAKTEENEIDLLRQKTQELIDNFDAEIIAAHDEEAESEENNEDDDPRGQTDY